VDDQADHEALQSEENGQVGEGDGLEADNAADGAEGFQELRGDEGLRPARGGEASEFQLGLSRECRAEDFRTGGVGDRKDRGGFFCKRGIRADEVVEAWEKRIGRCDGDDWLAGSEGSGKHSGHGWGVGLGVQHQKNKVGLRVGEGALDMGVGGFITRIEDFQAAACGVGIFAPTLVGFAGRGMTGTERCKQSGDAGGGFADEFDAGRALT